MTTAEAQKKAFVLEAFDTLFNKRDYPAAERFWSPAYIQHSAHIAPGVCVRRWGSTRQKSCAL
jgi:predicted SnoaL-like aldol condensation-catalyzing enzyme